MSHILIKSLLVLLWMVPLVFGVVVASIFGSVLATLIRQRVMNRNARSKQ